MVRDVSLGELPDYAVELASEVHERSGCPVVVLERDGLGYDSQVSMAGPSQPMHVLAYVPAYRDFRLHFIVNALVKISRVWGVLPDQRLMPVAASERGLPRSDDQELRRKLGAPDKVVEGLSQFLYRGLVRQVTSMPLDIRVERVIAHELPEHRQAQRDYLARQVHDIEATFLHEIAAVTPARIYAASTAMNVVLTEEAADIACVEPGEHYRSSPHRAVGGELRSLLDSVADPGYRGDRDAVDLWATRLGMRSWYEWRRLDEVR